MKKKKRTSRFSKKVIVVCLISIWIYVIINAVILAVSGSGMPDALTYGFFSVFGVQFWVLSKIKRAEIKQPNNDIDVQKLNDEINAAIERGE